MVEKTIYGMASSSGEDELHVVLWKPQGEVRGILQISHGMTEYIERYDRFAGFIAEKGILVIGNDHLGHGETAAGKKYGYFTPKDGSYYVVRDLHRVTRFIRKRYPDVPLVLMGHSMGSFMARRYAMTYGKELDGLILMGTGNQPQWILKVALFLMKVAGAVKGDKAHSKWIDKLCFETYNNHFKPTRTRSDWLSRDEKAVDAYLEHEFCNYTFTINGYRTLFEAISFVQKKENMKKLPDSLPMLFVSGDEDPVGNFGKGVKAVAKAYHKMGVRDVTCRLYPKARHEILNELEYEKTQTDIWEWMEERWFHQENTDL